MGDDRWYKLLALSVGLVGFFGSLILIYAIEEGMFENRDIPEVELHILNASIERSISDGLVAENGMINITVRNTGRFTAREDLITITCTPLGEETRQINWTAGDLDEGEVVSFEFETDLAYYIRFDLTLLYNGKVHDSHRLY